MKWWGWLLIALSLGGLGLLVLLLLPDMKRYIKIRRM
ncbi:DUF6893 family small protein [Allosalinactinospora lopnorensis]